MESIHGNMQTIDMIDGDVEVVNDNVKRKFRTLIMITVFGKWKIIQFQIQHQQFINILTMEQTDVKPIEIFQLEAKPELFVAEFYKTFKRIPLFDEMPYYAEF
eukprot:264478_1